MNKLFIYLICLAPFYALTQNERHVFTDDSLNISVQKDSLSGKYVLWIMDNNTNDTIAGLIDNWDSKVKSVFKNDTLCSILLESNYCDEVASFWVFKKGSQSWGFLKATTWQNCPTNWKRSDAYQFFQRDLLNLEVVVNTKRLGKPEEIEKLEYHYAGNGGLEVKEMKQ